MTSIVEMTLAAQLEQDGIGFLREVQILPRRRFRADFLIDEMPPGRYCGPVLVEVEGGTWVSGRHSRGPGFEADCEKQALAVIAGYRYLRCTSKQVEDGTCLGWIRTALGVEKAA